MQKDSTRLWQFERMQRLLALRAMASAADLASVQSDYDEALSKLKTNQAALDAEARNLESIATASTFDLDRWRIGQVALSDLTTVCDNVAAEASSLAELESSRRQSWHRQTLIEEHAARRCKDLGRRIANKRDDASTATATGIGILRARSSRK